MKRNKIQLGLFMAGCVFMLSGCFASEAEKNFKEGEKLLQEQAYEAAIPYLQNAVSQEDTEYNADVYTALGMAFYHTGDYGQALESFDFAIKAMTEEVYDLYCFRGDCEYRLERYEEAAQDFGQALSIKDGDLKIYIQQYMAWEEAGKESEGLKVLEKAAEFEQENPEDVEYYYDMGTIQFFLEEYEKAKTHYDTYLLNSPDGKNAIEAHNRLAYIYAREAAYETALEQIEKGLAIEEQHQSLRKNQIYVLEQLLCFEDAEKLAAAYLEDYPEDEEMSREYVFIQTRADDSLPANTESEE